MATKTKGGSTVGAAIGIAALVVGFFYIRPTLRGPEEDVEDKVTMRVDFDPKERRVTPRGDEGIAILVAVEGVTVVNERARLSPWTKTLTIPKGASLILNATQAVSGLLSCKIGPSTDIRKQAGSVVCTHNT